MSETLRSSPLSTVVHQWKETGSILARVLCSYLNLTLLLSRGSEKSDMGINDLTSLIDTALHPEGLLSTLSEQLSESREVLSKTRNRLLSPIYNIPTEILSKVFMYAVQVESSNYPVHIEFAIRTYYHRLYTLLEVCSRWREIGLSMPILWDLVPVIRDDHFTSRNSAISQILERSGLLPLDLAVKIPRDVPNGLTQKLAQYAHRYRTINILSEKPLTVQQVLYSLLRSNRIASVSELSMCVTDIDTINDLGAEVAYYFFLPGTVEHTLLQQLLQSLARFRFNGMNFEWSQITFSIRLVELRVHTVVFGQDTSLHNFLRAISTARRLQKLELISVISFPTPHSIESTPRIVLPELQALVLDDLYFNTLSILLRSITPVAYRLTLHLTDKCGWQIFSSRDPEAEREAIDTAALRATLEGIPVDTLLLKSLDDLDGIAPDALEAVVELIQSLNTIKIYNSRVTSHFFRALIRPTVPKIQNIHMTDSKITDEEGLKKLIRSHGLKMILLGGRVYLGSEVQLDRSDILDGSAELVDWLVRNVPNVRLNLNGGFTPPEFLSEIWQLWGR